MSEGHFELSEVTPTNLRCANGKCCAIFSANNGNYIIIGKKLDARKLEGVRHRVGGDEYAIEIPGEYLRIPLG